jgi:hypothetical protein
MNRISFFKRAGQILQVVKKRNGRSQLWIHGCAGVASLIIVFVCSHNYRK